MQINVHVIEMFILNNVLQQLVPLQVNWMNWQQVKNAIIARKMIGDIIMQAEFVMVSNICQATLVLTYYGQQELCDCHFRHYNPHVFPFLVVDCGNADTAEKCRVCPQKHWDGTECLDTGKLT